MENGELVVGYAETKPLDKKEKSAPPKAMIFVGVMQIYGRLSSDQISKLESMGFTLNFMERFIYKPQVTPKVLRSLHAMGINVNSVKRKYKEVNDLRLRNEEEQKSKEEIARRKAEKRTNDKEEKIKQNYQDAIALDQAILDAEKEIASRNLTLRFSNNHMKFLMVTGNTSHLWRILLQLGFKKGESDIWYINTSQMQNDRFIGKLKELNIGYPKHFTNEGYYGGFRAGWAFNGRHEEYAFAVYGTIKDDVAYKLRKAGFIENDSSIMKKVGVNYFEEMRCYHVLSSAFNNATVQKAIKKIKIKPPKKTPKQIENEERMVRMQEADARKLPPHFKENIKKCYIGLRSMYQGTKTPIMEKKKNAILAASQGDMQRFEEIAKSIRPSDSIRVRNSIIVRVYITWRDKWLRNADITKGYKDFLKGGDNIEKIYNSIVSGESSIHDYDMPKRFKPLIEWFIERQDWINKLFMAADNIVEYLNKTA